VGYDVRDRVISFTQAPRTVPNTTQTQSGNTTLYTYDPNSNRRKTGSGLSIQYSCVKIEGQCFLMWVYFILKNLTPLFSVVFLGAESPRWPRKPVSCVDTAKQSTFAN
jgi:hypothetical protein